MKAVILAAGMGTRLGTLLPKPLTALKDEKTILDFQIEKLLRYLDLNDIFIVVGHKFYSVIEMFPDLAFVYNNRYTQTNTAKSLLLALSKIKNEDVLWMNGDVYFDHRILKLLISNEGSCCAVDNKKCSDEEIKYTLNKAGFIEELSKQVKNAKGEALGINLICAKDLEKFKQALEKVDDKDYFEKGLENLTLKGKINLKPVDVNGYYCREIDFPEDLEDVKTHLNN